MGLKTKLFKSNELKESLSKRVSKGRFEANWVEYHGSIERKVSLNWYVKFSSEEDE